LVIGGTDKAKDKDYLCCAAILIHYFLIHIIMQIVSTTPIKLEMCELNFWLITACFEVGNTIASTLVCQGNEKS